MARPVDAQWPSEYYLQDHFELHQWDTNTLTEDEYDQSARYTIIHGERFEYDEPDSGRPRVGYWDADTGLLTVLAPGERRIVTHFRPDQDDYPTRMPNTTYRS